MEKLLVCCEMFAFPRPFLKAVPQKDVSRLII